MYYIYLINLQIKVDEDEDVVIPMDKFTGF
jgi:hypothetical protein